MNRRQRRHAEKRRKAGDPQQSMSDRVALFGKLPQTCDTCQKTFDKKNKDMVFSWSVVVRQETVRLFCPQCMKKAKEAIDDRTSPAQDE
tara:strand:- start:940 stop:1206 length:267 start_codon:yes stop_codon:yes gene_type:complete